MNRTTTSSLALLVAVLATSGAANADDGLDLKVYGDTSFSARKPVRTSPDDVHTTFSAASLDLFPTYSIDRLSFLAEIMFEGNTNNEIGVDLERVQATYMFADWLRIRAGRMHTAFGYYNDAYHHGKFFELTTSRPYMTNFEDGGGMLMAHLVGIGLDGKVPVGDLGDFHYDLEVGNGRGRSTDEVPSFIARTDTKQVNARLRFMPSFADGLILGVNGLYDDIPGSTIDPATPPDQVNVIAHTLHESALGAHVAYMENGFHLLAEGAVITHRETVTSTTYRHYDAFFEGGYSIKDFTPYVRYEHIQFDDIPDPFYSTGPLGGTGKLLDFKVGMKWLATENVALKVEGRHTATDGAAKLPAMSQVSVQCAFGF